MHIHHDVAVPRPLWRQNPINTTHSMGWLHRPRSYQPIISILNSKLPSPLHLDSHERLYVLTYAWCNMRPTLLIAPCTPITRQSCNTVLAWTLTWCVITCFTRWTNWMAITSCNREIQMLAINQRGHALSPTPTEKPQKPQPVNPSSTARWPPKGFLAEANIVINRSFRFQMQSNLLHVTHSHSRIQYQFWTYVYKSCDGLSVCWDLDSSPPCNNDNDDRWWSDGISGKHRPIHGRTVCTVPCWSDTFWHDRYNCRLKIKDENKWKLHNFCFYFWQGTGQKKEVDPDNGQPFCSGCAWNMNEWMKEQK